MLFNGTLFILILNIVHTASSNSSTVGEWLPKRIICVAIGAGLFVLMVIVVLTASNKSKVFRRYVATRGINSRKCCHILKIDLNYHPAKLQDALFFPRPASFIASSASTSMTTPSSEEENSFATTSIIFIIIGCINIVHTTSSNSSTVGQWLFKANRRYSVDTWPLVA
uniref:Uncharacterized protein n=1 Tax=Panagrellus redivivus TaxID=6233 RepID=A0A7E4ZVY4_PANRE